MKNTIRLGALRFIPLIAVPRLVRSGIDILGKSGIMRLGCIIMGQGIMRIGWGGGPGVIRRWGMGGICMCM